MKNAVGLALTIALLTSGGLARADVAPPPDYQESCTLDNVQGPERQCVVCGDAYHAERDACEKQYAAQGYSRECRTRGASTWDEIWCRSAAPGPTPGPTAAPDSTFAEPPPREYAASPPPNTPSNPHPPSDPYRPPTTPKSGSCGACTLGVAHGGLAASILLLLAAAALLRRRR